MILKLRKATVQDARSIQQLLEQFSAKGLLLPRPLWDIYSHIREFIVWDHQGRGIIGVCALHVIWEDLAELRSFCVDERHQDQGIGRKLAEAAIEEGRALGVKRVFTLTYSPSYFEEMGFKRVDKGELPQKVWADCVHCLKFPECDEIALLLNL
jgi:amino-acid N-acetyltransferase